jgi:uncharacterized protein
MTLIEQHRNEIQEVCFKHKVKKLFVFGSSITNRFTSSSDIDLLVDFESQDNNDYADNYFNLKFELERILKRKIDLLENKAMKNPYLREAIEKDYQLLYAA